MSTLISNRIQDSRLESEAPDNFGADRAPSAEDLTDRALVLRGSPACVTKLLGPAPTIRGEDGWPRLPTPAVSGVPRQTEGDCARC